MSKPAGHSDVDIPAVFVSQKAGIIMRRLITPGESVAVIIPVRADPKTLQSSAHGRSRPALRCAWRSCLAGVMRRDAFMSLRSVMLLPLFAVK